MLSRLRGGLTIIEDMKISLGLRIHKRSTLVFGLGFCKGAKTREFEDFFSIASNRDQYYILLNQGAIISTMKSFPFLIY